ncbi:hypothetical protein K431DRAFT_47520 [Polychaeton citri CBS 116435]|uniref:Uncharacterized protein n=1 Tax=Polychaeton citri CBS 116435 TaxID=1314669 RepID=A0A9P4QCK0_9PEZI|nr:hypothetical protein K431DRAFT_47520 [Polychaeton citri CBS 116435]
MFIQRSLYTKDKYLWTVVYTGSQITSAVSSRPLLHIQCSNTRPTSSGPMEKSSHLDETLTPSKPSFHIRLAKADDGYGIFDIFQQLVQAGIGTTRDEPSTLKEIQALVDSYSSVPTPLLKMFVAETDTSRTSNHSVFLKKLVGSTPNHSLVGCVILFPYRSTVGPVRARCFSRTGSMSISIIVRSSLDQGYLQKVRAALIEQVLAACREPDSPYKTIVVETSFKEDEPRLQDNIYTLQEAGFQVVGKLEAVLESNGVLYDRVFLQKRL